jgi:tripartite-type tricarboxylate transporter receptor subunit TctC
MLAATTKRPGVSLLSQKWSIPTWIACLATALAISTNSASAADDSPAAGSDTQLVFYIGVSVGGGYDAYARAIGPFLSRYLPGKPTVIFRNMPAADGLTLATFMANTAPRDGSVIAISPAQLYLPQVLTPGKFNFDVRKLSWVGTISTTTDVLGVFSATNVKTVEDAKKHEVPLGAVGRLGTGTIYPLLSNAMLGTKFKIIHGYAGGADIFLAMERGEVHGRVNQWNSWETQRPAWIKDGKLNFLFQSGPPVVKDVPRLVDLVQTPDQKAMIDVIDLLNVIGRSLYTTPGVAPGRVTTLRKAFDQAIADPEFIETMKKKGLELNPRRGAELQSDFERELSSVDEIGRNLVKILDVH